MSTDKEPLFQPGMNLADCMGVWSNLSPEERLEHLFEGESDDELKLKAQTTYGTVLAVTEGMIDAILTNMQQIVECEDKEQRVQFYSVAKTNAAMQYQYSLTDAWKVRDCIDALVLRAGPPKPPTDKERLKLQNELVELALELSRLGDARHTILFKIDGNELSLTTEQRMELAELLRMREKEIHQRIGAITQRLLIK